MVNDGFNCINFSAGNKRLVLSAKSWTTILKRPFLDQLYKEEKAKDLMLNFVEYHNCFNTGGVPR